MASLKIFFPRANNWSVLNAFSKHRFQPWFSRILSSLQSDYFNNHWLANAVDKRDAKSHEQDFKGNLEWLPRCNDDGFTKSALGPTSILNMQEIIKQCVTWKTMIIFRVTSHPFTQSTDWKRVLILIFVWVCANSLKSFSVKMRNNADEKTSSYINQCPLFRFVLASTHLFFSFGSHWIAIILQSDWSAFNQKWSFILNIF